MVVVFAKKLQEAHDHNDVNDCARQGHFFPIPQLVCYELSVLDFILETLPLLLQFHKVLVILFDISVGHLL